MRKKILITGGLGYLGGRIALHLAGLGADLRLLTRKPSEQRPQWCRNLEVVEADLLSTTLDLEPLCATVDTIIHLAAMNDTDCQANPIAAIETNGTATLKLLQAGERAGVKRFVYFSTAHVYGSPLAGVISESTLPRPVHPYAITHRLAEDLVLAAHERQAMSCLVIRLSNGMGAPADPMVNGWTLVVNDLCRQAVSQRRLVLKSSGLQQRDFITLTDVCRAVAHFLSLPPQQWGDGLFNLGGGFSMPILAVAEMVRDRCLAVLGFEPPIHRPLPSAGETHPSLDYRLDKLQKTGFSPAPPPDLFRQEIDATLKLCSDSFSRTAA